MAMACLQTECLYCKNAFIILSKNQQLCIQSLVEPLSKYYSMPSKLYDCCAKNLSNINFNPCGRYSISNKFYQWLPLKWLRRWRGLVIVPDILEFTDHGLASTLKRGFHFPEVNFASKTGRGEKAYL